MDWAEIWEHLRMAIPMGIQFLVLGLGIIIVQAVCNKFSTAEIAGFTTALRVEQLALQPMISFGIAMAVFTAQNYGARRFDRIREAVTSCSKLSLGFSVIAAILIFAFGEQIIGIFLDNPDAAVIEAAHLYILYTVPVYFFLSQIFIFRNACQGMGIGMIPMLAATIELMTRSFAAMYLSDIYGYIGLCLAEPISWISCAIFVYFSYRYFVKVLEERCQLSQ